MEIALISHIKPHMSSTESASRIPALSALMQLRFNFSINKKIIQKTCYWNLESKRETESQ